VIDEPRGSRNPKTRGSANLFLFDLRAFHAQCQARSLRGKLVLQSVFGLAAAIGIGSVAAIVPASTAGAATLPERPYLVSRDHLDLASSASVSDVALDGSGRFVAFSTKGKLVPEDTNDQIDVYLRDRWAGETELIDRSLQLLSVLERSAGQAAPMAARATF
jgi:hypothetical protein